MIELLEPTVKTMVPVTKLQTIIIGAVFPVTRLPTPVHKTTSLVIGPSRSVVVQRLWQLPTPITSDAYPTTRSPALVAIAKTPNIVPLALVAEQSHQPLDHRHRSTEWSHRPSDHQHQLTEWSLWTSNHQHWSLDIEPTTPVVGAKSLAMGLPSPITGVKSQAIKLLAPVIGVVSSTTRPVTQ